MITLNSWLKYKSEASGWPKHCDTQEQKDQYVEDFEAKEEIKLENIQKNPGRKQGATGECYLQSKSACKKVNLQCFTATKK